MSELKLPDGDVSFYVNGKWESYMNADAASINDIKNYNQKFWKLPSGTKCRYVWNGKKEEFVL